MMRVLAVLACVATPIAAAQPLEMGPRIAALGGAGAALREDPQLLSNPASLATPQEWFVHAFFARAYGLAELDQVLAGAGLRVGRIAVNAAISAFGFEQFRDLSLRIGMVSRLEASRTDMGVRLAVSQVSVAEFGTYRSGNVSVGTITALTSWLSAGLTVNGLVSTGGHFERGRRLTGGLMFRLADQFIGVIDAVADPGYPVDLRIGIEATPVPALTLRSGLSTQPQTVSLGIRLGAGVLSADLAMQRHDPLGWSRIVGVATSR